MKITFLGATKTVTGSNFLVEGAGKKFLVDCGLFQGKATEELENEEPFEFDIDSIDFMLLTHAHIDHSGRIPKLYKEGYRKDIIATKATCDLCSIMLPDSGHIQEMEVGWKNKKRIRKGEEELEPLYTAEEAARTLELFKPVKYDEIIEIDENIHVRFNDAGHMLGSSTIEVWIKEDEKEEKIVFSGDLGNNDIPLLSEPTMIEDTDYLVMESTYGSRLHMKNDDKAELFLDIVSETLEQGGTVVIPSFAVGRTQEILFEINKLKDKRDDEEFRKKYEELMRVPVYVDSPLAISATEVFEDNMDLFDEETKEYILNAEKQVQEMVLKLPKDTIVIISADHGHKDIEKVYSLNDYPEIRECLIMPESLESRSVTFWVKEDMKTQFEERFNRIFKDDFWLMTKEEFLEKNMLGFGEKHPKIDDFIGNYIALSTGSSIIKIETFLGEGKKAKKSTHCGLTKEEMEVPLIVID